MLGKLKRQIAFTLGICLALATRGAPLEASEPVTPSLHTGVVYPFEALMAKKRGKVDAEFVIDPAGHLISVSILHSDAPEFSAAVLAYADATDFSRLVGPKPAAASPNLPNTTLRAVQLTIEFDERTRSKVLSSISTPSAAALEILRKLRADPSGKEFSGANNLDVPLKIVEHNAPIFPRELQDTHAEGNAVVEFYVANDGQVVLPRVVSATHPAFGFSACQSVKFWKFNAPIRNGQAVVVRAQIPVRYSLKPSTATRP